ncbi:MAG: pilin [Candidatus Saccharibacteria bacterium]
MKVLKLFIAGIFIAVISFIAVGVLTAVATYAQADIQNNLCMGANLSSDVSTCAEITEGSGNSINSMVATIINIFSWIVGVICVIMIIYGGFRYVTAGGDSARVGDAKNTILYAIVGLVIVALAQVIVKFVLSKVTAPAA